VAKSSRQALAVESGDDLVAPVPALQQVSGIEFLLFAV